MKKGFQKAHIHPSGLLSGIIYLKTITNAKENEGAIEFTLHDGQLPTLKEPVPRILHQPKIGDIVLFPSSLYHKTIPIKQDQERSVIAFDLLLETAEGQKITSKSSSISLQMVTSQLGDMFVVKISSIGFTARGSK